jgi:NAD(P)-dependent dehydrogenase (short-subunit alcohol dehydrogenase family)
MRIVVIGATGTIGRAVVEALEPGNEIIEASRSKSPVTVDIEDKQSIWDMFVNIGEVDAIVCAAGNAKFAPLYDLSDEDFDLSLRNKLMGQVNLVRAVTGMVRDGGSFTLTSGVLAQKPMKGSAAISLVNAGLEGFVRAVALEMVRGIRVNVVSPPWVTETLIAYGMDPSGGMPAAQVAKAYVRSVTGKETGAVISPA